MLVLTGTQAWRVGAAPGDRDATYQPLWGSDRVITDDESNVLADRGMLWEAAGATAGNAAGQEDAASVSGGTSELWDPQLTLLFIRS